MDWFRFYSEVVRDPKVQKLSPTLFKHWINVLCLANDNEPRGRVPMPDVVAFHLRIAEGRAVVMLDDLLALTLLDADEDGNLSPHGWGARQYRSDNVTERVRKHRRNVSETPPETDTETEAEQNRAEEETEPEEEGLLPFEPPGRTRTWDDVDTLLPSLVEDFPGVDVIRELGKAKDWVKANGKRKKDYVSFFRNWLRKAEEFSNDRRAQPEQRRPASEPSPFAYLGAKVP